MVCNVLKYIFDILISIYSYAGLYTPLHTAYLYGHTQIAQYLIQHGADVYAMSSNGDTP